MILAQTTQPALFDASKLKLAGAAAIIGGVAAFYHDLNQYLQGPVGATWDWKKTAARVSAGLIGGFLAALGAGEVIGS